MTLLHIVGLAPRAPVAVRIKCLCACIRWPTQARPCTPLLLKQSKDVLLCWVWGTDMVELWSCQKVVRRVTVSARFTYYFYSNTFQQALDGSCYAP